MKITGITRYGYIVEMSLTEIDQLSGERLQHQQAYGPHPNEHLIGTEVKVNDVVRRIGSVLAAKKDLDRAAEALNALATVCQNVDLAIPELPAKIESRGVNVEVK